MIVLPDSGPPHRSTAGLTARVEVAVGFAQPWTSYRSTPEGRRKPRKRGFAPPGPQPAGDRPLFATSTPAGCRCPFCDCGNTPGEPLWPTLCRAIYWCNRCRQPFEQLRRSKPPVEHPGGQVKRLLELAGAT
jgi:ring-1,2-phenylacetyl-CoA epoxidase subunit PaaD